MKQDRRGFLKLFGLSSAAIAAAPTVGNTEPTVEIVRDEAKSSDPNLDPKYHFKPATGNLYRNLDVRDEPLWSVVRIAPNEMRDQYAMFQTPMGHLGAEFIDTNMHIPGSLIQPEMYCIKKIGLVFSPQTIPALRSAFIDRYVLSLYLGRKRYWHAPLATVFSVGEPDRDKGFAKLPDAGFVELEIPLVIEAGLYFNLELMGRSIHPCGKITAWGVFKGLHAVGIQ